MAHSLASLERDLERDEMRPLYLISGDEVLLVNEALEAIVTRARTLGYDEREILFADDAKKFRFAYLREQVGAGSLFAARRLMDLRVARTQLDRSAANALIKYLDRPVPDVSIVMATGQLEARQRNSAWFRQLSEKAFILLIWPLKAQELAPWLVRRAAKAGFRISHDAVRFLAHQVEGNLLAASQEVEKLSILAGQGAGQGERRELSLADLHREVGNSSHYNNFQLVDAALDGAGRRVSQLLRSLRLEGEEPMRLLGLILSQLRMMKAGEAKRIPAFKRQAIERTGRRLGAEGVDELLRLAESVDRQVKGVLPGDPWQSLERLLLRLAGQPALTNEPAT